MNLELSSDIDLSYAQSDRLAEIVIRNTGAAMQYQRGIGKQFVNLRYSGKIKLRCAFIKPMDSSYGNGKAINTGQLHELHGFFRLRKQHRHIIYDDIVLFASDMSQLRFDSHTITDRIFHNTACLVYVLLKALRRRIDHDTGKTIVHAPFQELEVRAMIQMQDHIDSEITCDSFTQPCCRLFTHDLYPATRCHGDHRALLLSRTFCDAHQVFKCKKVERRYCVSFFFSTYHFALHRYQSHCLPPHKAFIFVNTIS
ncbi:hypothetical protein SDC9_124273 [bioreactor metagenome]|uniref:Uncharacterized protein n=1 Tax=bioreactor metagenome TaxID=1076179 RepID=A0A645CKJ3_9ZZZZ